MRGTTIATEAYPGRATVVIENLELANLDVSLYARRKFSLLILMVTSANHKGSRTTCFVFKFNEFSI
jgi:hypothetical protein